MTERIFLRVTMLLLITFFMSSCAQRADQAIDARALSILNRMTLEEKVGQIIQADISDATPQDAKKYHLGAILNGGNSAPGGEKTAPLKDWVALADAYWAASTDRSDGGVGIPLLWGTDAVHGHNNLQSATIFPHNIGLGAANDPELMSRIAKVTAAEIRATGLDWTFAPTLAVAQDDRWGRTYESYSENPDIVAAFSKAMVEGLQGNKTDPNFLKGPHVIATAKHFVADGGTQFGIDKGDAVGDLAKILKIHDAGYAPAIDADVQVIMASFSSINGMKMHGFKALLTDKLRGEMGFKGFVIGDWNGHAEVPGCTPDNCPASLDAGVDMYMAPDSWRALYDNLLRQVKSGEIKMTRLDEAVTRILKVKIRTGLFEAVAPSKRETTNPIFIGSADHRAIAREAVRKSLVLLKNNDSVLPLKPSQNILVTGSGADSIQQQTGGWTLSWQGDDNRNDEFTAAETIYAGLRSAMKAGGGSAVLSVDGKYTARPDVAIVVFGEQPYAEFRGDRSDLVYETSDGPNLALLKSFKEKGIPVVAVFLSGRPLWINPHLNASDAFVAAWLPGTEGGGIADMLVANTDGKPRYDFTGRLSFSWPLLGDGEPINGTNAKNALFPLQYGLSLKNKENLAVLSEASGMKVTDKFDGSVLARGDATNGLRLFVGDSSNANIPASALVSQSLSGAIQTRGIDYKAQEDARQISWNGTVAAEFSVRANRPIDLAKMGFGQSAYLAIEWKIDKSPQGLVDIILSCGEGCDGRVNATKLVGQSKVGIWTKVQIPLTCFIKTGFDPSKMTKALAIKTDKPAQISLHSVAFAKSETVVRDCASFG